ncbi:two-component system nitrogen regulation sensor histidine kinase NtrY [Caulobacter ginsengisoli]|uniref:histidine kinase n=1 Tax=Caulobacter ginsengisoli TaxID=400775 RepID=A0ABU0IPY7_9CAUL|nr:PAS domain-containing sensor histidine kinase [Caulobacter ginsengisoli]MDQ0463079.1 two-component system nitrogen regulation sensor histidine kinase NtrY [Caulobacter ginsengisoli]
MSALAAEAIAAPTPLWRRLAQSPYVLGGGYVLSVLLTAAGVFLASSPPRTGPVSAASEIVLVVLGFNLVLLLTLAAMIAWRVLSLREADAGARLTLRFVAMFSAVAVAPAVVVALLFGVLINRGVESWFSQRVTNLVETSANVARSYVKVQLDYVEHNVNLIAQDLDQVPSSLEASPVAYGHLLATEAADHGFSAIYLLDHRGMVLAQAETLKAPPFLVPPATSFQSANDNYISTETFEADDAVRALSKLKGYRDAYLYITRPVEKGIIRHLRETEASLAEYSDAAKSRARVQFAFLLSYIETALLVLVGAAWLGIGAARSIAGPVARLVKAAGSVAGGDLSARVETGEEPEEIAMLSRAFNNMTRDLQDQQAALKAAGLDAEARRQFIETVLSGVSAGVLGLDAEGRISAANRQAAALLDLSPVEILGRLLSEAAPEFAPVVELALEMGAGAEEEVDLVRDVETRRLRVRATGAGGGGVVLTFDDITRLVTAQRNAAWKDVARRIAHEIKNPLTPIQLSAERLKRKYRKDITQDLETFDRCTDTIIRQVGDIGRMVDEFSSFARMPAPRFADQDPAELLRQAVFAQRVASPDIAVEMPDPPTGLHLVCDERMVGQALANVLKNAAEAVSARDAAKGQGRIVARLKLTEPHGMSFEIEDNGVGLPARDRDRLTEPYMTTREKGTGLGLAIVKRIMEDHGGELGLTDASQPPGAKVTLSFPTVRQAENAADNTLTAPVAPAEEVNHGG